MGDREVEISRDELAALSNAIGETFEAVEDWELSLRTGFDREFYLSLIDDVGEVLDGPERRRLSRAESRRTRRPSAPASRMDVPELDEFDDFDAVVAVDAPGAVTITAIADDGQHLAVTWNEAARTVHARWTEKGRLRADIERKDVSRISLRDEHARFELWIWAGGWGQENRLILKVGEHISMHNHMIAERG